MLVRKAEMSLIGALRVCKTYQAMDTLQLSVTSVENFEELWSTLLLLSGGLFAMTPICPSVREENRARWLLHRGWFRLGAWIVSRIEIALVQRIIAGDTMPCSVRNGVDQWWAAQTARRRLSILAAAHS